MGLLDSVQVNVFEVVIRPCTDDRITLTHPTIRITSVSNGSGLGLGPEPNRCNASYHTKNRDRCFWAGSHQKTRPLEALHFPCN